MKKRRLGKKGFTLVEVILAISMIAIIALPLLTVFSQSIKVDQTAKSVLNANYISQDYTEKLDATTYEDALMYKPHYTSIGEYYLSAKIEPFGTTKSLFSEACDYAHLVCQNEIMLAVMPDGQWHKFSSLPSDIEMSISGGNYTFEADDITLSGPADNPNCALLINAVGKDSAEVTTIDLGEGCKSVLYCEKTNQDDFVISGSGETYADLSTGETSLIHVSTFVYETPTDTEPVALSESYINIKNW